MQNLNILHFRNNATTKVAITGDFKSIEAAAIKEQVLGHVSSAKQCVVLDLRGVSAIDQSAVTILALAQRLARVKSKDMIVEVAQGSDLENIMYITKMHQVFQVKSIAA